METQGQGLRVMMNVGMRYMQPADLVDVSDIARRADALGWEEADFVRHLRMRNGVVYVAVRGCRILGFAAIKLLAGTVEILNVAVHPDFQRHRVGTQLIDRVLKKLNPDRRKMAHLEVPERCVGVQMFLKRNGFLATSTQRGKYGEDDSYVFERGVTPGVLVEPDGVAVAHG